MEIYSIYKYENISNGKIYVGLTKNVVQREKYHLRDANVPAPKCHFHRALKKYGLLGFYFSILEDNIKTLEEANVLEINFINKYDSFNSGYNCTTGGGAINCNFGELAYNSKFSDVEAQYVVDSCKSASVMANEFGVSVTTICDIRSGRTRKFLNRKHTPIYSKERLIGRCMNKEKAQQIYNDDCSRKSASVKYEISEQAVKNIRINKTWKNIDRSIKIKYSNSRSKITNKIAQRVIYDACSHVTAAIKYDTSKNIVEQIRSGQSWKHLNRSDAPAYVHHNNEKLNL